MRLFIGLDIAEPVRARVAEVIDRERAKVDARWVRSESLHLTLIFFGELSATRLPEIASASKQTAARHAGFQLSLAGAGTFGPPLHPRVLWLDVGGALDPLQALVADLEATLGVVSDPPKFVPHLTLARSQVRNGDPMFIDLARRLARKSFGSWDVDHFTVYQSAGGRYRALETVALR